MLTVEIPKKMKFLALGEWKASNTEFSDITFELTASGCSMKERGVDGECKNAFGIPYTIGKEGNNEKIEFLFMPLKSFENNTSFIVAQDEEDGIKLKSITNENFEIRFSKVWK